MFQRAGCIKRTLSVLFVAFVSACSSGGDLKVLSSAASNNLPTQPAVRLVVNAVAPDSEDVLSDVRAAVLGQLQATGRFSRVVVGPGQADLVMTVDIVQYAKVTVGERLLVGVLAGRNRVGADVKIVETSNNALIKSYEANGESAAHPLSSESGVSDAVREVAKQVASGAALI